MLNKRKKGRQKRNNIFLYLILVFMLFFSLWVFYKRENAVISAGSFGGDVIFSNSSFYDLAERMKRGG